MRNDLYRLIEDAINENFKVITFIHSKEGLVIRTEASDYTIRLIKRRD